MKAGRGVHSSGRYYRFISHMVQMKAIKKIVKKISLKNLYIPHGSDESRQKVVPASFLCVFISHMVQMKDLSFYFSFLLVLFFISHMVQMKVSMRV